jgi:hypothetical protein
MNVVARPDEVRKVHGARPIGPGVPDLLPRAAPAWDRRSRQAPRSGEREGSLRSGGRDATVASYAPPPSRSSWDLCKALDDEDYPLAMEGALYYPFIAVPASSWWTRTMLYWDYVGTIVPHEYINVPEMHEPYTLELVRAGVVHQVFPDEAGFALREKLCSYLDALTPDEVDRRRVLYGRGAVSRIHRDKFLTYQAGLDAVRRMGLAESGESAHSPWIRVERTTAAEFMAALAMALCQASLHQPHEPSPARWVPTTDRQEAVDALLSGLVPSGHRPGSSELTLRVRGEFRAAEIRADLLDRLLPVPDEIVPTDRILKFRNTYGHLLPPLRRYLEGKVDDALAMSDEDLRYRMLDRLAEEVEERVREAEAYLREAQIRRISRSSLLRVSRLIPGAGDYTGRAQDVAGSLQKHADFESQPLAYLAFARTTFRARQTFEIDPWTGRLLADAMGD